MPAKLRVRPADGNPFEVEVGNTATIGRSRENTISFHNNPHVSRQHAIIRCHNAYQFQIMDLGSRNGTFVNGRRVITPTLLTDGAVIRITNNELIFEQSDQPSQDTTYDVTIAAETGASHDQNVTVAVMVCDIRGFSTMAEILAEDELARTLGQWFRDAGNIVHDAGGTIDKFIGDAVLAYWTRETQGGLESRSALNSALKLLKNASGRRWMLPAEKPFEIAVALHHGVVTCGNMGFCSTRRNDYWRHRQHGLPYRKRHEAAQSEAHGIPGFSKNAYRSGDAVCRSGRTPAQRKIPARAPLRTALRQAGRLNLSPCHAARATRPNTRQPPMLPASRDPARLVLRWHRPAHFLATCRG